MNDALDIGTFRSSAPLSRRIRPVPTRPVMVPPTVCGPAQSTRTVTLPVTGPVAGATVHVCAGPLGCVDTVTLNVWTLDSRVANGSVTLPETGRLSAPLSCSTRPVPVSPTTWALTVYSVVVQVISTPSTSPFPTFPMFADGVQT